MIQSHENEKLTFGLLADVPALIPLLTEWFQTEWAPYYGAGGPGDARADLLCSCNRRQLPLCLVAFSGQGEPVGTVSLKDESISHSHLSPWVAELLVAPQHRGKGVGTALMAAVENKARELGFAELYVSTDQAAGIVESRGWRAFDRTDSLRGPVTVYSLAL